MIHVTRGPIPDALEPRRLRRPTRALQAWFGQRQRGAPPFEAKIWEVALAPLRALFHDKCAFCDDQLEEDQAEAARFRPEWRAMNLRGEVSAPHYWWLAYSWQNLHPSCPACAQMKAERFPVGAARADVGAIGRALAAEGPLLLDPCVVDPEDHLAFREDGHVVGRTPQGRATVEAFGLDRRALVARRAALWEQLEGQVRRIPPRQRDRWLASLEDARHPFAALRRTFRDRALAAAGRPPVRERPVVAVPLDRDAFAVADDQGRLDRFYGRARFVERAIIRDLRGVSHLDVDFGGLPGGWHVLLGENGTGKSTLLQGIALALMDEETRELVLGDPGDWIRPGQQGAEIRVWLTGSVEPVSLALRREPPGARASRAGAAVLLLGYGATRLLPRRRAQAARARPRPASASVLNLFDPFHPLADADDWLATVGEAEFARVAAALSQALALTDPGDRVVREGEEVSVVRAGQPMPLFMLSTGQQAMVATVCDILRVLRRRWPDARVAEGIVLLDEIGAHLHPTWMMRVVSALRRTFPRVQFIATTHHPLCLRGLRPGEVTLLERGPEGVVARGDLPGVAGMTTDQLLRSAHFGLESTTDARVDRDLRRFYALAGRRQRDPGEERELRVLRGRLDGLRVLGADRRQQMMFEAIARFEHDAVGRDAVARRGLRAETLDTLARLWRQPEDEG